MAAGGVMPGSTYIKEPHPVDVYVGKRLRMRRKLLGLSQDDLGKQVGITFQQIQKYERGVNRMGASRLWEFAQALQISEAYFFDGYNNDQAGDDLHSEENEKLLTVYYHIADPMLRSKAIRILETLSES